MFRLRTSIAWRMFFGFFILSLIPVGVALFSIERQERETALNAQLEVMRNQARIYSGLAQAEPDKSTEIAAAMTTQTNGDIFYLIAINGTYLASSNPEQIGKPATDNFSFVTYQNITTKESTVILDEASGVIIGTYRKSRAEPLAVSVGKIENKDLTGAGIPNSIFLQIAVAFGLAFVGVWFMLSFTFNSLSNLIGYAKELSKGQLSTPFQSRIPRGEMGELASSLQVISANLQKAAVYADSKFEERNREFERRSTLLKAVADVGKAITSFRNLSELLEQTTHLIHEHFGYYHAGIFLLDEHKEYAVLSAANSEGGKRMLENKHQLKVGGIGIVGYVTQNAKARIALDVGADAVYFDNPHLPKTRSEMALPLVVGGQILGALDVQSTEPQAFSEEDISTLQILAEQLAVAIQNANLLSETEKALESARMVYGEISREAWSKILRDQPRIGFIATPPGTVQTYSETLEPNLARAFETGDIVMGSDNLTIGVPIKIRGQSIGAIRLKKSEIAEAWTQDEINLAIALSDQLTGALESARLYNESQQRGARETLVSDISARISAASHTEAILRETVQELGQTIGNVSITFQLLEHFSEQKQIEIQESEYLPGANGKVGD